MGIKSFEVWYSEPSDPVHAPGMDIWMGLNGYNWNLDTMGEPGSLAHIGPEWAASISAPGSLYKFYASDGGLRAPMIMSGPGIPAGARQQTLTFVTDVTPTLLDLAGVSGPGPAGAKPMTGRSLAPLFSGAADRVYGEADTFGIEVSGNAALFRDRYKIVRNMPPVGDGAWRLYDLLADPSEVNDLSRTQPDLFQSMLAGYEAYTQRAGVLALPEGSQVERQLLRNIIGRQLAFYGLALAAIGIGVVALVIFLVLRLRGRRRKAGS